MDRPHPDLVLVVRVGREARGQDRAHGVRAAEERGEVQRGEAVIAAHGEVRAVQLLDVTERRRFQRPDRRPGREQLVALLRAAVIDREQQW
jgi:hypothetical protein